MRVPATWSFEDVTGVHYFNHDLPQNLFSILASFDVRSISQYDMDVLALWLLVSNFTPAVSTIWMSLSFFYIITNIQHSSTYTGIWYDLKDLLKHGNFYLNQEFLLAEVMLWACTERLFSRLQVSLTKISRNTQDQRHHFLIGVVSYWTSTDSSLKWRHKSQVQGTMTNERNAAPCYSTLCFDNDWSHKFQFKLQNSDPVEAADGDIWSGGEYTAWLLSNCSCHFYYWPHFFFRQHQLRADTSILCN